MSKSIRELSRIDYVADENNVSWEQVRTGALLRIADALEKPQTNFQARVTALEKAVEMRDSQIDQLMRCNAALRGVITRMKKRGAS